MMERNPENLKGKNILVAGGSGLIGVNLTKKLKSLGVNTLSTYFSKKPPFLEEDYRYFDFTQFDNCIDATKGQDYVLICAARISGVKIMRDNPTGDILANLKISAGLLEACALNKVEKVVVVSSSTVYQEADYPISEDQLDLNKPPYELYFGVGWVNRFIEQLAKFYYGKYGLKIGIIRPTNIYGPYDNFDDERAHVVPSLIKRAINKEEPFIVWGNPKIVRDFIYVDDFTEDLLDVLEGYCTCDQVNVASGEPVDIETVVKITLETCGHRVTPEYDHARPAAIPYLALDTKKFTRIFGKRKKTLLREGVRKTVDWYKSTYRDPGMRDIVTQERP